MFLTWLFLKCVNMLLSGLVLPVGEAWLPGPEVLSWFLDLVSLRTMSPWWGTIFPRPVCMAWGSSPALRGPFSSCFKISAKFLFLVQVASYLQLIGQEDNWQIWGQTLSVSGTQATRLSWFVHPLRCHSVDSPQRTPPIPLNRSKTLHPENIHGNKRPFLPGVKRPQLCFLSSLLIFWSPSFPLTSFPLYNGPMRRYGWFAMLVRGKRTMGMDVPPKGSLSK